MPIFSLHDHSGERVHDPRLSISMGAVEGCFSVNKFGSNPVIGTTFEDIWDEGDTFTFPSGGSTLEVASTSTDDAAAGTGARTLQIEGCDANHEPVTEVVTLNGQTPVTTTASFLMVNRAKVLTAGTGSTNAGIIRIAQSAATWTTGVPNEASLVSASVRAGYGQTQLARYTVPAGYVGYVTGAYVTAAGQKTVTFRFNVHVDGVKRVIFEGTVRDSEYHHQYNPYATISAGTTLWISASADSTPAVEVAAGFDLVMVPIAAHG